MEKKRNNQSIYTTENYIIQCKGKRVDIVFVSTGFELIFHALELQHQSLSLICRALNHLATSAMKKIKLQIRSIFFSRIAVLEKDIRHVLKRMQIVHICILI
jgi:hypothetical protein